MNDRITKQKFSTMIYKQFYSELGKLLYAVADIDGIVTAREKKLLQEIVLNELVPAENRRDEFGTNIGNYTAIEFEFLQDRIADPVTAFESFVNFAETHHAVFDKKMRAICVRVAGKLSGNFGGLHKKEEALIGKLQCTFERMNDGRGAVKYSQKEKPEIRPPVEPPRPLQQPEVNPPAPDRIPAPAPDVPVAPPEIKPDKPV